MKKSYLITFGVLLLGFINNSLFAQLDVYSSADNYLRQSEYQKALNTLTEHIEISPYDARAYVKRAFVYDILGQMDDKERDLNQANYLNPFAYLYINQNRRSNIYDKKVYDYDFSNSNENLKKSPINNSYYSLYLKDKLDLHSQDSLLEKAIYFLSRNDIISTEETLENIEFTENISGILYDIKGLILLKKDSLLPAIESFTKSIESMPNFPLAYHNRAIASKLLGNYESATQDLLKAISLNEDISVFYFTLAKLNERMANPNEAINNYQEAISLNPSYLEARMNYSMLQKTLGNYDRAVVELRELTNYLEDNPNKHFINGGIHLTYGDYEAAISEFDAYLISNSNDSDAIFNRGLARILSGYKREGCSDIATSIELKKEVKRTEILSAFCPDY
jgi:tetratricopeptide (TPR) repeat protein